MSAGFGKCPECGEALCYQPSDRYLLCTKCGWRENKNDPVSHPSHYTDGKIETIDYIEDKKLNYHLGNAVKYISRAGKKDPEKYTEDLQKAVWYISREIERVNK